jgi:hypothetical protein
MKAFAIGDFMTFNRRMVRLIMPSASAHTVGQVRGVFLHGNPASFYKMF